MTEECLECKYCEIIEYGACGFIGETVVKCRVCEENTEDKTLCWEAAKENYMSYQTVTERCNGRVESRIAPDGYVYCWDE